MELKSLITKPTKEDKQILIVAFALTIIWCLSQAHVFASDDNGNTQANVKADNVQNYSAIGIVSGISSTTDAVSISGAEASDGDTGGELTFDLKAVNKIESTDYTKLSISDIYAGDKIVVQGLEDNGVITIKRVIDFSWDGSRAAIPTDLISTSTVNLTATSTTVDTTGTIDITASTTENTASTTIDLTATSTASTTDSTQIQPDSSASTTDDANPPADQAPIPTVDQSASTTGQ